MPSSAFDCIRYKSWVFNHQVCLLCLLNHLIIVHSEINIKCWEFASTHVKHINIIRLQWMHACVMYEWKQIPASQLCVSHESIEWNLYFVLIYRSSTNTCGHTQVPNLIECFLSSIHCALFSMTAFTKHERCKNVSTFYYKMIEIKLLISCKYFITFCTYLLNDKRVHFLPIFIYIHLS